MEHYKILDTIYEKSLKGIGISDSVVDLAESYCRKHSTKEEAINSLINFQCAKTTSSGFLSGLGGITTMAVMLPANLTNVLYVQMRMAAAIAHLRGYDIESDQVKTYVYVSLCGNTAKDVLKEFGIKASSKYIKGLIGKVSGEVLKSINQKVGFRLITKSGSKGLVNLTKCLPIVGGVVGGTMDLMATKIIAEAAKEIFEID